LIEYGTGISFAEPEDTKVFKPTVDTRIKSTTTDRRGDIPEYEGRFQIIGGTAGEIYMPEAKQTEAAFSSTGPLITKKITAGPEHSKRRSSYSYPTTPSFTSNNFDDETSSASVDDTLNQIPPKHTKQIKTLVFRVQIFASNKKLTNTQYIIKKYNILKQIFEYQINNMYRYSVGAFRTFPEALTYCQTVKNKGINDAFVVAYKNGIKIPIKEALKD
ncbi:MAG: SPOR domain-containing protein, partial [Bacteroidales bacterium]|nr:SPOR domain-containing protein [Bacteroidales bacterium]